MGEVDQNQPHIAVLAFPFGTHAAPLFTLTRKLAEARPEATFSFFNTAKSNESIFKSKSQTFLNIKIYSIEDGMPENYIPTGEKQEFINLFLEAMPTNYERALKIAFEETEKKISCVLSDSFLYFSADLAEERGVPWVALWTAAPCSLSTHFYTDFLRQKIKMGPGGLMGRENETIDFIPGMFGCCLKDLQEGVIFGDLESQFSQMLHQMGRTLPRAVAVVINSVEELDPIIIEDLKSKFQKCLTVGPFNLTSLALPEEPDTTGCLPWLNNQKPASVVYLSFGTVTTPSLEELVQLAEGLEAIEAPFIWSIKEEQKKYLPKGFLERSIGRGIVVPWTPQAHILQHKAIGVFVTHCGWNSISEGITGGVPMLCRPFFGDQRLNGWMVSDVWGIGLRVDGGKFTKDATVRALELLLSERRFREKGEALKELVKEGVGSEGSSTKNFESLLEEVFPYFE